MKLELETLLMMYPDQKYITIQNNITNKHPHPTGLDSSGNSNSLYMSFRLLVLRAVKIIQTIIQIPPVKKLRRAWRIWLVLYRARLILARSKSLIIDFLSLKWINFHFNYRLLKVDHWSYNYTWIKRYLLNENQNNSRWAIATWTVLIQMLADLKALKSYSLRSLE
jgi:hypothetical protein